MACGIYIKIALELLKNSFGEKNLSLEEAVNNGIRLAKDYYSADETFKDELAHFRGVFYADFKTVSRDLVRGRGYVVVSLEAALWCIMNNDSYRETALAAVNLGEDTDTTAAIAGGLAGIYYGYDGIPSNWLDQIARADFIEELCDKLSNYLFNILED